MGSPPRLSTKAGGSEAPSHGRKVHPKANPVASGKNLRRDCDCSQQPPGFVPGAPESWGVGGGGCWPGPIQPPSSGAPHPRAPESSPPCGHPLLETHRWTQPPRSCWPQRCTHRASLVGGARRGRGLCLELVSAGGRDPGPENEESPKEPTQGGVHTRGSLRGH